MNVSGHRISTTEVESALVSHPSVAEAAVVGATDPTTGQAIVAFVILRGNAPTGEIAGALRDHVAKEIGPIAKPRQIMVVPELPKTRPRPFLRLCPNAHRMLSPLYGTLTKPRSYTMVNVRACSSDVRV
jgi:acetyl-CoA synthetase